jgi:hypothetical protein
MATPIYKSFMGRLSEAWYALSADEQQALMPKMSEAGKEAGVKTLITCNTA